MNSASINEYIYIPMGGSKYCVIFGAKYRNKLLIYTNILIVFAFTALWHGDFAVSLLIWGCLMGIGMIPEILINHWYCNTKLSFIISIRNNSYLNRYIHAFFGGINGMILISANMIGYGPGLYAIIDIWKTLLSTNTGWYVLLCSVSWVLIANLMSIHMKYMQSQNKFASISITHFHPKQIKNK